MKHSKTIISLAVAGAVIATVCILIGVRSSIPTGDTAENQVIKILERSGCTSCHSVEPRMPFQAQMQRASRFMPIGALDSVINNIDEVTLAKFEQAFLSNSMPPAGYRHVKIGSSFSNKEREFILEWVRTTRTEKFNNGLAAEEFVNEPIRPIPSSIPTDPAKVALGKMMFNDTRISLDNTISCATCHVLEEGGADHADERTSEGINGLKGNVNSPTVYNSVFQVKQFWNGRAEDLAQQAGQPPVNPVEMGEQTWDDIVARLNTDKALVREFEKIYPGEGITEHSVCDAIAEYEKTLITPDTPFDRYLKGDKAAISAEECAGYRAFRENDCATCHSGILAGGASFEYLGVADGSYFKNRDSSIVFTPDDEGLKSFTGCESDLYRFKVPTLRNIIHTSPYFHDGSILTLEEAVKAMMVYQTGAKTDPEEIAKICTFLRTLSVSQEELQSFVTE